MADVNLMPADVRALEPKGDYEQPKVDPNAMNLAKLEIFLGDIKAQPEWRESANKCNDYYDGNQLDAETIMAMEERGLPTVVINLIKPTIDAILGQEVKNRTDWVVKAETDEQFETAKAITVKLKEAEKSSRADRACSDAYSSQVKSGIGWVEVGRESDPFKYPYRCNQIHRSQIWWDWRSKKPDLEDARFLVRKNWYDVDQLHAFMPEHAELIDGAYNQFPNWESSLQSTSNAVVRNPSDVDRINTAINAVSQTSIDEAEWLDTDRKRAALYEVWYKVFVHGHVLRTQDGRVVEFDKDKPEHVVAVQEGVAQLEPATFSKVRLSIWLGPHRLYDMESPYSHNRFPYVPFFGYREDRTGIPYGKIKDMIDPQDEVNARRAKMLWLLSSRQVIIDEDAPANGTTHDDIQGEVNRPDAYIVLNKNRANANAIKIDHNSDLSQQQYQMMLEAKANVQDTSGMHTEALGKRGGSTQSGEAIKNLIEQSTTSLGEMNDNFVDSRTLVGELLMSMVVEDMGGENIEVKTKSVTGADQVTVLNQTGIDEYGNRIMSNDVSRLRASVTMADITSTSTYRQQVSMELMRLSQTLPPALQPIFAKAVVEASDLPNKETLLEEMKGVMGGGSSENLTPEQQQQAQQQAQQQQQIQQRLIALEMAAKEAEVAKLQAEVDKLEAEANLKDAQTKKIELDGDLSVHDRMQQGVVR